MSIGPINNLSSYLQSVLNSALQGTGTTTNTPGNNSNSVNAFSLQSQTDSSQLSPIAQLLSTLQQIQESDPIEYQQVTQQIATNLQNAAQTATSEGNTTAANQLNQLATDFTNASQTGQLPNIQDLAEAVGGGGHHHHHHGHGDAAFSSNSDPSSSNSSTSSTASTATTGSAGTSSTGATASTAATDSTNSTGSNTTTGSTGSTASTSSSSTGSTVSTNSSSSSTSPITLTALYQEVTQEIASTLQNAAQTATSDGYTAAANQLSQFATDFANASQTGLPNTQDPTQAVGGHHHHHHGHGDDAFNSNSDSSFNNSSTGLTTSTGSTNNSSSSSAISQFLAAYQANSSQSESLNPMSIIMNTLSTAGITISTS